MDQHSADGLAQSIDRILGSRRVALRLATGSVLAGAAGWLGLGELASAKHKRKRKKSVCFGPRPVRCSPTASEPNAICYPRGAICCGSELGGGGCPPGSECCAPNPIHPAGSCAPVGHSCCPASFGGYCPDYAPLCCPPTPQEPTGLCLPSGFQCCPATQGGGGCRDDQTCCPPSPGFPGGSCAPQGWPCPWEIGLTAAGNGYRDRRTESAPGSTGRVLENPDSWK
jgi:hypothetical protein